MQFLYSASIGEVPTFGIYTKLVVMGKWGPPKIGTPVGDPGVAVADLEIQKGGFSHWRTKRPENFWVATPTSGHVNAYVLIHS